jgi:O-antigen ligase
MEVAIPVSTRARWSRKVGLGALSALGAFGFALLVAYRPFIATGLCVGLVFLWCLVRRLEWAALGLFLLVPLGRLTWLDPVGALDITKLTAFTLGLIWFARCLIRRDRALIAVWTENPVCVFILLFSLAMLISLLGVHDFLRSFASLIRLVSLCALLTLVVAMVRSKHDVKIALALLLVSGLVSCLIGLWEARTHQYFWMRMGQQRVMPTQLSVIRGSLAEATAVGTQDPLLASSLRVMSTFGDFNFMGGYMAVLLGVIAGCFLACRRWYVRAPLLGMTVLVLYDLAKTGSRGGLIGVAVTAVLVLLLSQIRARWFIFAGLVIAVLALFPVVSEIAPQYRGGISLKHFEHDQRYGYWQMALHMMADHPLVGVGVDNFVSLYSLYRVSPALMYTFYCHNIYLQMGAEAGILGLLTILGVMGSAALSFLVALRRTRDESWRSLLVGLLAAFGGYAVFSASCNTLHDQSLWLLLALSAITLRATRAEEPMPAPHGLAPGPAAGVAR